MSVTAVRVQYPIDAIEVQNVHNSNAVADGGKNGDDEYFDLLPYI